MLWTALVLGLAGSLHCAGMCGPLALALPAGGGGRARFVAGRLAYNGGRLATYAALGAALGLAGRSLALAGVQRGVSVAAGLLLIAGVWLLPHAAGAAGPAWRVVGWLKRALAGLLRRPGLPALGLLGLLNGLLPCGLVYAAGAASLAAGGAGAGALYMVVFGLGTVPMMLGLGLGGRAFPVAWRLRLTAAVPAVVGVVGGLLVLRGLALGIPWLSPAATGACPHCSP
jgi:hypothetical protein